MQMLLLHVPQIGYLGDKQPPRYKTCVNSIEQQIPLALARAFTEQYFSPEIQASRIEGDKLAVAEIPFSPDTAG